MAIHRQRDERAERDERRQRAAERGGIANTSRPGAHSASTTFWSRCAQRNVCSASGCSSVENAAKRSAIAAAAACEGGPGARRARRGHSECERRHETDGLRREVHGATLATLAGVAQR